MRVLQLILLEVACICPLWLCARAFLTERFQLLLDGSTGELDSSYTSFKFLHIYSCSAQCAKTEGCWVWSYDVSSVVCHVFPSSATAGSTTGTPTTFRTYSLTTIASLGYYVPEGRYQTWLDGFNSCNNDNAQIAYEPDPDVVREILKLLSADSIFIGLQRSSNNPSIWVDINNNEIPFSSIHWENGQPDNAGGNENKCLSYKGELADITEGVLFNPKLPVLCIPKP